MEYTNFCHFSPGPLIFSLIELKSLSCIFFYSHKEQCKVSMKWRSSQNYLGGKMYKTFAKLMMCGILVYGYEIPLDDMKVAFESFISIRFCRDIKWTNICFVNFASVFNISIMTLVCWIRVIQTKNWKILFRASIKHFLFQLVGKL